MLYGRTAVLFTCNLQLSTYGNISVNECRFLANESTCKLVQRRGDDLEQLMIWREQRFQKPGVFFQPSQASHSNQPLKFDAISPSLCDLILLEKATTADGKMQ